LIALAALPFGDGALAFGDGALAALLAKIVGHPLQSDDLGSLNGSASCLLPE
jgi:hypothetical protein